MNIVNLTMFTMKNIPQEVFVTLSAVAGALLLYQILFYFIKRWAEKKKRFIPEILRQNIYYPGLFLMITASLWLTMQLAEKKIDRETFSILKHGLTIVWIVCCAWLVSRLIAISGKITLRRYVIEEQMNYSHRKARTKFELVERVLNVLIFIAALSLILMTFKGVRQIGSTLLASAGVLGLIIGFAAQKSLGALFAGIQIAISQPIRIGDTVVVEKEFGTIGEITLTYVVVNTWDGRRLIVPINYFLEKTFENWTRKTPDIIAKMTFHADYSLPVDAVRTEFSRLVQHSELWDGRVSGFVVIAATEKTIELRGIASSRNSGDAFNLQCMLRENLIAFVREKYPKSLPKLRIEGPEETEVNSTGVKQ